MYSALERLRAYRADRLDELTEDRPVSPDAGPVGQDSPTRLIDPAGRWWEIVSPDDLPADWRVDFEERAAIREYDGGQCREHAEAEALREIIAQMRRAGWKDG